MVKILIRERYLITKHDLDCINSMIESIDVLSQALILKSKEEKTQDYAERINKSINKIKTFLTVGEDCC